LSLDLRLLKKPLTLGVHEKKKGKKKIGEKKRKEKKKKGERKKNEGSMPNV